MPLTREQGQAAFTHVVETVLASPATSPLAQALERAGFDDIRDILILRDRDIDTLDYRDGTAVVPLQLVYRGKLRAFLAFVDHRMGSNTPSDDAWTKITPDKFDTYRMSPEYMSTLGHTGRQTIGAPHVATITGTHTRNPIVDFNKGIDRDSSQFSMLKDEKQWDQWQRSTMAQARAQGVADVLNPDYKPCTDAGKALFAKKNEFMYAVFERTLLTDTGKTAVQQHEGDSDAQAVWKEVVEYYTDSIKTSLDVSKTATKHDMSQLKGEQQCDSGQHSLVTQARHDSRRVDSRVMTHTSHPPIRPVEPAEVSTYDFVPVTLHDLRMGSEGDVDDTKPYVRDCEKDADALVAHYATSEYSVNSTKAFDDSSSILAYITSARIDDGHWHESSVHFVMHWREKVHQYEKLIDPIDQFSGAEKRRMLENAVCGLQALRAVKDQAEQYKTQTGLDMPYGQYVRALIVAASGFDEQYLLKRARGDHPMRAAVTTDIDTTAKICATGEPIRQGNPTHPPHGYALSVVAFIPINLHDLRMGSDGDVDNTLGGTKDPDDFQDYASGHMTKLTQATKQDVNDMASIYPRSSQDILNLGNVKLSLSWDCRGITATSLRVPDSLRVLLQYGTAPYQDPVITCLSMDIREVLAIMHQYILMQRTKTICSSREYDTHNSVCYEGSWWSTAYQDTTRIQVCQPNPYVQWITL